MKKMESWQSFMVVDTAKTDELDWSFPPVDQGEPDPPSRPRPAPRPRTLSGVGGPPAASRAREDDES